MMADGNEISAGSVSNAISPGCAPAPTVRENKVFTGSAEGNQDSVLSTDGKKVPTGSVSRNNINSGSLVNNGVSAGHTGGNKDCAAPDDDRKDPTGSTDGEKVKCQRRSRKVKQKQAVMGKHRWRTSPHRLIISITLILITQRLKRSFGGTNHLSCQTPG